MSEIDTIEQLNRIVKIQERIIKTQEEQAQRIKVLAEKTEKLEGLDLSKYLKNEDEVDEVIDKRIASLLEITNQLHGLNKYKQEAIYDFLAKKSSVNKTNLKAVVIAFDKYLEDLL